MWNSITTAAVFKSEKIAHHFLFHCPEKYNYSIYEPDMAKQRAVVSILDVEHPRAGSLALYQFRGSSSKSPTS